MSQLRDWHKMLDDFKNAVGNLPNYRRSVIWEFVKAKDERIAELVADIDELANSNVKLREEADLYHGGKSDIHIDIDECDTAGLASLVERRGLICVLDMLNEYGKKQEDSQPEGSKERKKWWSARVHIEFCSNVIEMLWEAYK